MSAEPPEREPPENGSGSAPGLAKLAASAWWHTTEWTVGASLRGSTRLLRAAVSPESAAELAQDVGAAARRAANAIAGRGDTEPRDPERAEGRAEGRDPGPRRSSANGTLDMATLRDRGEALLRKSRDVRFEEDSHPAYERILSELAPDEGRILLLMLTSGPQPAVDIRTGGPIGLIRSRLISPGRSMIGDRAGCRYTDRVPSYLHNLFRLGLIWFSRETIQDPLRYQVLEAQPGVLEAIHSVRQAKVVRRSIHLTPFGEDFCRACLPVPSEALLGVPEHRVPHQAAKLPQPPTP